MVLFAEQGLRSYAVVGAELGGKSLAHDKQALSLKQQLPCLSPRARKASSAALPKSCWPMMAIRIRFPAMSRPCAGPGRLPLCRGRSTSALQRHIPADYMYSH